MRDSLPKSPWREESGIINPDYSSSNGTHWVAYNKNKKVYITSIVLEIYNPQKKLGNTWGITLTITMRENKPLIVPTVDTCPFNSYSLSHPNFFFTVK